MSLLAFSLRLTSTRVTLAVAALLGLLLGAVPLLGVHGVESALIMGVVLPPFTACIGARLALACRGRAPGDTDPVAVLRAAALAALLVLAVPTLILALNALRVRNCSPLQGLAFIALGPGFGVVLAAAVGVTAGRLIRRRWLATTAAVLLPLSGMVLAVNELYSTPAVFAYGQFFGFFHGSFYDEEVGIPEALLTLRLVSVAMLIGITALLSPSPGTGTPSPSGMHPLARASLVLLALVFFAYSEARGPALSLAADRGYIAEQLGERVEGERCTVVAPVETPRYEVELLSADCDVRVAQMQSWFGLRRSGRVTAFFFRSAEEKGRLTGAARTNIAKPWLGETYLRMQPWPHPVLAHEIAHLVTGAIAPPPLRLAGRAGGLWPNPALIEGAAVAAAWEPQEGMTPHQWARAMLETDLAPPLEQVLGAGFLKQPKRQAYVIAGSFLRHLADRYGAAALRRIYARGDIASALKVDLSRLEREWLDYLKSVPLPDHAHGLARVRFAPGSILSSVCPHLTARLRNRLRSELAAAKYGGAAETCEQLLAVDAADAAVRATLVTALARDERTDAARAQLDRLLALPGAPLPLVADARQELGDAAWRSGDPNAAAERYRSSLEQPLPPATVRLLQVKLAALGSGGEQERLLREFLLGDGEKQTDGAYAVHLLRELRAVRPDGLALYLEARQLAFRQRFAPAADLLQRALEMGLPSEQMQLEALRLQATVRVAADQLEAAEELWRSLAGRPDPALRAEANDFLQRIAYRRATLKSPVR